MQYGYTVSLDKTKTIKKIISYVVSYNVLCYIMCCLQGH